jgi:hypothetical protein
VKLFFLQGDDMKVFVWTYVAELTQNYHSGGGLIVFAETEDRAYELAKAKGMTFSEKEIPDDVCIVEGGSEVVYVMADAGCC